MEGRTGRRPWIQVKPTVNLENNALLMYIRTCIQTMTWKEWTRGQIEAGQSFPVRQSDFHKERKKKENPQTRIHSKIFFAMPRGRKRKRIPFVPREWIHNTSSEGEDHGDHEELGHLPEGNGMLQKSIVSIFNLHIIMFFFSLFHFSSYAPRS